MTRSKLSSKVLLLVCGIGLSIAAFAGQPAAAQESCPDGLVPDPSFRACCLCLLCSVISATFCHNPCDIPACGSRINATTNQKWDEPVEKPRPGRIIGPDERML